MSSPTSESIHRTAATIADLPIESSKEVSTSSAVSYAPSIPATPSKTRSSSVSERVASPDKSEKNPSSNENYNPIPQCAPGASAAVGHTVENSIPLSIFPTTTDKYCIAFCGLPGTGKTLISRRLARYLSFFHAISVQVFNVAEYRLKYHGKIQDADWFDSDNKEAQLIRDNTNQKIIEDAIVFLQANASAVAIIDSTNPTHKRRLNLMSKMRVSGAKLIFIEVTNELNGVDASTLSARVKSMPDYHNVEKNIAEKDYLHRLEVYAHYFESLDSSGCGSNTHDHSLVESKWSYFKCDHLQQKFVVNKISGYLPMKIVHFIMNMRINDKSFYLSRHGQSEYNAIGRIGGDSGLSEHGMAYAHALADFAHNTIARNKNGKEIPARLWTSTLRRTKETSQFIRQKKLIVKDEYGHNYEWVQMRPRAWHHLDELFAGSCDGMTYEEIEERFPEEFSRRNTDKLAYRYPRGESYLDVIARIEPIIIEMERHREPLLIVGHQGILRIIYAFYMGLSRAEAPYVSVPLNCVLELVPSAYTCTEKSHQLYFPENALPHDGQTETAKKPFNSDPQSH